MFLIIIWLILRSLTEKQDPPKKGLQASLSFLYQEQPTNQIMN
jgi:hypothetical protein